MNCALIIFQKNAVLGKVKTRLAAGIGIENALKIYTILVDHTHGLLPKIKAKKYLFFSDFVDHNSKWQSYHRKTQEGDDLGERMYNAILEVKKEGAERIVIIGTDCYDLTAEIIQNAFESLQNYDYCLGPAKDGGYYLIGTTQADGEVFLNKTWSTDTVFEEAKQSIQNLGKSLKSLELLSDVDCDTDLGSLASFLQE